MAHCDAPAYHCIRLSDCQQKVLGASDLQRELNMFPFVVLSFFVGWCGAVLCAPVRIPIPLTLAKMSIQPRRRAIMFKGALDKLSRCC